MYRIKELRLKANLSQAKLAKEIDISQSVLCDYENGKTDPTAKVLIALSLYFGESIDYIVGLEDETGTKYRQTFNIGKNEGLINFR